eukprot:11662819-Ditylum_brightwellii.AAC.1
MMQVSQANQTAMTSARCHELCHHSLLISPLHPTKQSPICPTYLPTQTVLGLCRAYIDHG